MIKYVRRAGAFVREWLVRRRLVRLADSLGVSWREGTTDYATLRDVFVNQPYAFQVDFEPQFVIEVGANVGYASIYLARRFPGATIIAIEPETHNFAALERNVARFSRVAAVHAAVGSTDGVARVVAGDGEWGFHATAAPTLGTTESPEAAPSGSAVEMISVTTLMRHFDIPDDANVLLKVNISGFESEMFDDLAHEWISRMQLISVKVPWVMASSNRSALFSAFQNPALPPFSLEVFRGSLVFRRES